MGKYGPYVFVSTSTNDTKNTRKGKPEKPAFYNLNSLGQNYQTCSEEYFLKWLEEKHGVSF